MQNNFEATRVLWEEFKYIYNQYWEIIYKFGFAIIIINVIPYVKPDIIKPLEGLVIFFPIIGVFLSIVSSWILLARYKRAEMIKKKYDELLSPHYLPSRLPNRHWWDKIFLWRIGIVVFYSYSLGLIIISFINIVVLCVYWPQIILNIKE